MNRFTYQHHSLVLHYNVQSDMDAGGLPACRPRTIIVTDLNSTEDISPKQQKEKKKTGPKDYVLPSPFTCRPRSNDTVPNKKVVIKVRAHVMARSSGS